MLNELLLLWWLFVTTVFTAWPNNIAHVEFKKDNISLTTSLGLPWNYSQTWKISSILLQIRIMLTCQLKNSEE